jgi:hypothetical protein
MWIPVITILWALGDGATWVRRINMIDWNKIKLDLWNKKFGEGTKFDLDYGKLLIIALLVYHIFFQG